MKTSERFHFSGRIARGAVAILSTVALLVTSLAIGVSGQQKQRLQTRRLSEEQRILHVLNRLGFGARPGDVERVKALGIENYIALQLNLSKISDVAAEEKLRNLQTLTMTTAQLYEKYPQPGQLLRQLQRRGELPAELAAARQNQGQANVPKNQPPNSGATMEEMARDDRAPSPSPNPAVRNNEEYRRAILEYYMKNGLQQPQRITAELQASRILRAVYSERQLQEVLVDFWTNHFNVFAGKGADRWLLTSYDRDTIRPHTMGKFYDLLLATAQSPAMLFYLDNFQSVSPNTPQGPLAQRLGAQRQRRGINENYARELMELHTMGVDGGYTQKDVQEVARCFTGWTIFAPRGGGAAAQAITDGPRAERLRENAGKFFFNPRAHDDGEKIVLGHKISAGGGIKDGLTVLDILTHHPSTAKYIATKLARHFVTDTPSRSLVDRIAAAFTRSDGDIRETLKAIFSSAEFNSPEAYRAKVKRPFELAISAIRTLGADTNGGPQLHQWITRMGEPLYMYQTPNGYSDTAESWVNTGGLLERMNFGLALASNRIPGTRVKLSQFTIDNGKDQTEDNVRIMDRFLNIIVGGDISPKTRETLLKQLDQKLSKSQSAETEVTRTSDSVSVSMEPRQRREELAQAVNANIADPVTRIVGLILGSPEFQRQ